MRSIFVCLTFLTVTLAVMDDLDDDLDHDPQVVIACNKPAQHVNLDTGAWVVDKNNTTLCTADKKQILKYCKAVYPTKDIRNIVEANKRVLVDGSLVLPYRCLVGDFESDALLVPPKCRFEHMHETTDCQTHDVWHQRASNKCKRDNLTINDYGVLIPCDTGKFTGVEFVCCPPGDTRPVVESEAVEEVKPTARPTSVLGLLKSEISKLAQYIKPDSVGCDRKKYQDRRNEMGETHRLKVETLIKKWQDAEKRYNVLKSSDGDQAASSMAEELENFKNTLNSYDEQAKLERARLKEEHHQCTQLDLNNKKNKALRDFVTALEEEPQDGNKILEAIQSFVKFSSHDRLHNLRYFEYIKKHHPVKIEEARATLQSHFKGINKLVNESMLLLYKLPDVARRFQLDLPDWIPKHPALPTEKPTVEKSSAAKEPTDPPSKGKTSEVLLKTHHKDSEIMAGGIRGQDQKKAPGTKGQAKKSKTDPESVTEDERSLFRSHSQATFSAIIGLSCGALLIMIIIVVAMAMRRTRPSNRTKTVLVDADGDGTTEKSHLINMQENGYENPTYKFYDY